MWCTCACSVILCGVQQQHTVPAYGGANHAFELSACVGFSLLCWGQHVPELSVCVGTVVANQGMQRDQ
jgi:hypothetical protein